MGRRMKKYIAISIMAILLVGCSNIEDSISIEDVKKLVIEEHTRDNGAPSIVSIEVKNNFYLVKWENKGNKESGIDKVTIDGEIKMVQTTIE